MVPAQILLFDGSAQEQDGTPAFDSYLHDPKLFTMSTLSPKIEDASWGKVRVEGYEKPFKDVKLFPGGAREWDWNETGTRHDPGVQEADVRELVEQGAGVVILSQGYWKRLKVPDSTRSLLKEKGVEPVVLPTGKAIDRYNEVVEKDGRVGALIHSTC